MLMASPLLHADAKVNLGVVSISFYATTVPPPEPDATGGDPGNLLTRTAELFSGRPIWSAAMLSEALPGVVLDTALARLTYKFKTGVQPAGVCVGVCGGGWGSG